MNFKIRNASHTVYEDSMNVKVVRRGRVIDEVFKYASATMAALIYINFGCALTWSEIRKNLKRPVGPAIGLFCQFCFLPIVSTVVLV